MWDDLAARARGLATHLLGPGKLAGLDEATSLADLAQLLGAPAAPPPSARSLERAARRRAAANLAVLARWTGTRAAALAVLFEDEDRRSLRAILRGAVAGAPPEERIAGSVPTPALGEASLVELSRQPTAAAVAALLVAWSHPYGDAIAGEAARARPDLFALEGALDRRFAERARAGARRGGAPLRAHLRALLDAENVFSALALAGGEGLDAGAVFLDGGARLGRDAFLGAVAAGGEGVRAALAGHLDGTRLGRALTDGGDLEAAALADGIDEQRRLARLWPSGPAPVILLVLGRRAEIRAVDAAAWRLSFAEGAP